MEQFYFEIPSIHRKKDAIDFINEFYEHESNINGTGGLHKYLNDYEGWLEKLQEDYSRTPSEENVPARTYFLVRSTDDKIVGMINIRLSLNERLKKHGGHIGYSIRPTERGKGYNKINLYLGLKICQSFGIPTVRLDATKENLASWKTMEALGGKNVKEFADEENGGIIMKNYEIDVNESITNNYHIYEPMVLDNYDVVFESENINYVKVSYKLLSDYLSMVNDPDVRKFISRTPKTFTEENEAKWIAEKLSTNMPIYSMLEKDTDNFIGNIELMDPNSTEGELGISITSSMQDKHFGSEAIRAFITHCFEKLNIERIFLKVYADNTRAIHVYEKLGFQTYKSDEEDVYMEMRNTTKKERNER